LLIPSWAERKRRAWLADLKRFICRSRFRVGWCEFSALLLRPLCFLCSRTASPRVWPPRNSPAYTVIITRRGRVCLFRQLAQPPLGGLRVALALNKEIQHHPALVDRAPQPVPYLIAVGNRITRVRPHRSVRTGLPHTAPTLGV